jgi:DNA-directed RNA polymerase specialized sigma24 family protein
VREALDRLLAVYRAPIIRRLALRFGATDDQAQDWFQGFAVERVWQGTLLARARRERGRFRALLLTAAENYARSQLRRALAEKRHPHGGLVSWDELTDADRDRLGPAIDAHVTKEWAVAVLSRTLELMAAECRAQGETNRWLVFKARCLDPLIEGTPPTPYKDLVKSLGLEDPAQSSNLLLTAKRMFERLLRQAVAEYAGDGADIDREIAELRTALAQA